MPSQRRIHKVIKNIIYLFYRTKDPCLCMFKFKGRRFNNISTLHKSYNILYRFTGKRKRTSI